MAISDMLPHEFDQEISGARREGEMGHGRAAAVSLSLALAAWPAAVAGAQPPSTPWGDPDLQGAWTNTTTTPLQRPLALAQRESLTVEERAELDEQRARAEQRACATELVVLQQAPPPTSTGFYNHNYQILQTPDHVVIYAEMIHDARVIPLDGRPHLDASIRQWMGDSRAQWDGDTLVVETTNFTDKVYERRVSNTVYGASRTMQLVERFRRVDADTLDYRFTVTDPATFAAPWTAAIPMTAMQGPIFEYACHEGNYSMENMLRGARMKEGSR